MLKTFNIAVILVCAVVYLYINTNTIEDKKNIYQEQVVNKFPKISSLKSGDLILRRAYGVDSNIAVNFSDGEKRYSHAGIIVKDINSTYVIHSLHDKKLNYNGVIKETLSSYLKGINIWSVYRYDLNETITSEIVRYVTKLDNDNIYFDNDFDLKTDNKMYCSEFIYKAINSTAKLEIIKAKKVFMGRHFVTISNLYENKYSKLIENSHLKQ